MKVIVNMAYNKETGLYEGFIYKIWNELNDRVYIGQTRTTIPTRWSDHKRCTNDYPLYRDMKDNIDKFHIEQIEKICKSTIIELRKELNTREKYYIESLKTLYCLGGYNLDEGGTTNNVNYKRVYQFNVFGELVGSYESKGVASIETGIKESCIKAALGKKANYAGLYLWSTDKNDPPSLDINNKKSIEFLFKNAVESTDITKREYNYILDLYLKVEGIRNVNIFRYNIFGELEEVYDNPYNASCVLGLSISVLKKHLFGEYTSANKSVIRYFDEPFNRYPLSSKYHLIDVYTVNGNYVGRFCGFS